MRMPKGESEISTTRPTNDWACMQEGRMLLSEHIKQVCSAHGTIPLQLISLARKNSAMAMVAMILLNREMYTHGAYL